MCRPTTLAAAQRIPGVTPAALLLLLQHVRRRQNRRREAPSQHLVRERQMPWNDAALGIRELARA